MKKILKGFVFLFSVLLLANNVFADTVTTNVAGVVVKNLNCVVGSYYGNLVNRSSKSFQNILFSAKSFDNDGDPIGNCEIRKSIPANSGGDFTMRDCNCLYSESVVFTIYR